MPLFNSRRELRRNRKQLNNSAPLVLFTVSYFKEPFFIVVPFNLLGITIPPKTIRVSWKKAFLNYLVSFLLIQTLFEFCKLFVTFLFRAWVFTPLLITFI